MADLLPVADYVERILATVPGAIILPAGRARPTVDRISDQERASHAAFVATLGDNAVWRDYLGAGGDAA